MPVSEAIRSSTLNRDAALVERALCVRTRKEEASAFALTARDCLLTESVSFSFSRSLSLLDCIRLRLRLCMISLSCSTGECQSSTPEGGAKEGRVRLACGPVDRLQQLILLVVPCAEAITAASKRVVKTCLRPRSSSSSTTRKLSCKPSPDTAFVVPLAVF